MPTLLERLKAWLHVPVRQLDIKPGQKFQLQPNKLVVNEKGLQVWESGTIVEGNKTHTTYLVFSKNDMKNMSDEFMKKLGLK